jgi:hypothetical protein
MRTVGILFVSLLCISQQLLAEGIDRIEGAWVNNGNTIAITRNQFGWDLWQDNKGRASMELSSNGGGNIQVTFRGGGTTVCNYYVTTTNNKTQMVLKLVASSPDSADAKSNCIDGTFNRVDTNNEPVEEQDSKFLQVYRKPDKPVEDGVWSLDIKCTNGATFSTFSEFIQGRHAGSFANGFANDLTLSYLRADKILLKGYLGPNAQYIEFRTSKGSDGKYNGPGKWGSTDCAVTTGFVHDYTRHSIPFPSQYSYDREVASLELKCADSYYNNFQEITYIKGLAAFAYKSTAKQNVVAHVRLGYDSTGTKGKFTGYLMAGTTTVVEFNFNASPTNDGRYYYSGWGTVGDKQNCSITGYATRY